jgi:ketopantoate reductase
LKTGRNWFWFLVILDAKMPEKSNVLLVGSGGVGTMGAYNLEAGGRASVTAVLRSNYEAVKKDGFNLTSMDHGGIKGWKPTTRIVSASLF